MVQAAPAQQEETSLVIVLEDDETLRESFHDLFASVGLDVVTYADVRSFLAAGFPDRPACLVLDVRMPGESGLELQDRLRNLDVRIPIIFITGFADVEMSVRAMKRGAINFLPKPIREQDLLEAVAEALRTDRERRQSAQSVAELRALAEKLTPREIDVLRAVNRGLLNKQIAFELGLAETTVKMHRSNAFKKLKALTPTDLVQKVRMLNL